MVCETGKADLRTAEEQRSAGGRLRPATQRRQDSARFNPLRRAVVDGRAQKSGAGRAQRSTRKAAHAAP
jgi:hypothetical protein